jgi:hypothetical protein
MNWSFPQKVLNSKEDAESASSAILCGESFFVSHRDQAANPKSLELTAGWARSLYQKRAISPRTVFDEAKETG